MDDLLNLVSVVYHRFSNNLQGTLASMSPEKWIRLVIIAGTYMLLRPYLLKLGARSQMNTHERESAEGVDDPNRKAAMSPNELRGRVNLPEDSDSDGDEDDSGKASGADWGKRARRRQREMIKKLLDAEEKRLQETREEEEDKDIEEFLVKE
ncbi:protein trafficking Pga2 [Echria macrotheca]|uniref:Protein trafficking Pga2 n=1 Tax=Echria macrotheca TaxID=438768 RepID=A0AAJ0FF59_9PEZI|nr:protein trafficking Pga2 [Echria macrotheca]